MRGLERLRRRLRGLILPRPSREEWDQAFAAGRWDFLHEPAEGARLAVAAHYVAQAAREGASVLDIGCGEGMLATLIAHLPTRAYLGVDLSGVAVERARARNHPRARFLVADAATWVPDEPFDVVVLNEMLYYLPDPAETLARLLATMRPGAALVVSIYDKPKTRALWRLVRRHAEAVDTVSLRGAAGARWRIGWFAKP